MSDQPGPMRPAPPIVVQPVPTALGTGIAQVTGDAVENGGTKHFITVMAFTPSGEQTYYMDIDPAENFARGLLDTCQNARKLTGELTVPRLVVPGQP